MSTQQQEYRPSSPFPLHWLMLGGAATYMLSKRPEKEILEVTGQSSKEKAYMMTLGVFVACFCVSTFVRNRMLGSKMSLFGGGTPPQAAPAAPASNAGAAPATGKSKKKSKKAD